jgi:hypothetical protein
MSAYTLKLTNGTDLVTIQDGGSDTTRSSLTLFGKNFAGYGQPLNENQIKMLENFSLPAPPQNPLTGQLWWDSANKQLNVFKGTWKVISGPTIGPTAPNSDTVGDLWWDTTVNQLKTCSSVVPTVVWTVVGPTYTSTQGLSGSMAETIRDTDGNPHTIVSFYVGNELLGILSNETFPVNNVTLGNTPLGPMTILVGFNMIGVGIFSGTATNASKLGNHDATAYLRSDIDDFTTGKLSVRTNSGLTVGLNDDLRVTVAGSSINFDSAVAGRDITFNTTISSALNPSLTIDGTTGRVSVPQIPLSNNDVTNKLYVDTVIATTESALLRADGTVPITGNILINQNDALSLGTANMMFRDIFSKHLYTTSIDAATGNFASIQIGGPIASDSSATSRLYVDSADAALQADIIARDQQVHDSIVGFPGGGLTTLASIASAINNDPNFNNTVSTAINLCATSDSPVLTGLARSTIITNTADSSDKIATTSFVHLVGSTINSAFVNYATLIAPTFSNNQSTNARPSSTTAALGDEATYPGQIATLSYVNNKIANSIGTTVTNTFASINNSTFTGNTNIATLTVSGSSTLSDVLINGNLVVNGTTTSLNVTTLDVADLNITLARNAASASAANGAGLTVNGANATLIYANADDSWNFNKTVTAPLFNGIASSARYADLAENYVADAKYEPGTVLDFGGDKEVTLSDGQHPTRVAGVVTSNPAYLMNSDCKGEFVVALALQGRVPCKVIGYIQKGDILVSNGDGVAKRSLDPKPGTIIGKALETHNGDTSLIEVAVGRG